MHTTAKVHPHFNGEGEREEDRSSQEKRREYDVPITCASSLVAKPDVVDPSSSSSTSSSSSALCASEEKTSHSLASLVWSASSLSSSSSCSSVSSATSLSMQPAVARIESSALPDTATILVVDGARRLYIRKPPANTHAPGAKELWGLLVMLALLYAKMELLFGKDFDVNVDDDQFNRCQDLIREEFRRVSWLAALLSQTGSVPGVVRAMLDPVVDSEPAWKEGWIWTRGSGVQRHLDMILDLDSMDDDDDDDDSDATEHDTDQQQASESSCDTSNPPGQAPESTSTLP